MRQGFPVPYEGKIGGRITDTFHEAKTRAKDWNSRGMKVMGVTPGPGVMNWKPDEQGKMRGGTAGILSGWENWVVKSSA